MDTAQPIVGTADHYARFVELCRARIDFLQITYDTCDAICGFPQRYTATLLCQNKTMSVFSLFTLARALALLPVFQHDEAQLVQLRQRVDWITVRRNGSRWRPRVRTTGRHRVVELKLYPDLLRKRAMLGVQARMEKLSSKRRSAIARKAALARWRRGSVNGAAPDGG
jgi:hypothetical protein